MNEEVYCLTNLPASGSSSLSAVGYFLQWMPDLATNNASATARAPHAYALMRESVDSDSTFLRFQKATLAAGNNVTPLSFMQVYGQTKDNTTGTVHVDQLAAYVWDLRFRIDTDLNETTDPDGDAPNVPKDHSGVLSYQGDGGAPAGLPYPNYLPPYVEVRFRALSATAGRRLEGNQGVTQQTWNDTGGSTPANPAVYNSIIQPNAQQFILRVPLLNATPQPTPTSSPTP